MQTNLKQPSLAVSPKRKIPNHAPALKISNLKCKKIESPIQFGSQISQETTHTTSTRTPWANDVILSSIDRY